MILMKVLLVLIGLISFGALLLASYLMYKDNEELFKAVKRDIFDK